VLTPDFRTMLAGPGEFHFAMSADSHGNTCVRSLPGNTSSVTVAELIGTRIYQVKPSEQVVFRSGQIDKVDSDVPLECGCPPPHPLSMAANPPSERSPDTSKAVLGAGPAAGESQATSTPTRLTNGPETAAVPPSQPNDIHVQVDAPFVFSARDRAKGPNPAAEPPKDIPANESSQRQVHLDPIIQVPSPPEKGKDAHPGFFRRLGRFFGSMFR